jgi:hypothetical protein
MGGPNVSKNPQSKPRHSLSDIASTFDVVKYDTKPGEKYAIEVEQNFLIFSRYAVIVGELNMGVSPSKMSPRIPLYNTSLDPCSYCVLKK